MDERGHSAKRVWVLFDPGDDPDLYDAFMAMIREHGITGVSGVEEPPLLGHHVEDLLDEERIETATPGEGPWSPEPAPSR